MDRENIRNACTTMAEMIIGAGDDAIRAAQDLWACGQLELVMELAEYAIYSEERLEAMNPEDYPGVYDYEVSGPFGRWFMNYVIEHGGEVPSQEEGRAKLDELIAKFFEIPTYDETTNTWSG